MKQPIRYFSIGLLTASLIILIFVSFFEKGDGSAKEGSIDEMITALTDDGYHVLSSSEYISLSVAAEQEDDDTNKDKENSAEEQDANEDQNQEDKEDTDDTDVEEPEVYQYTLNIEPNMLGPTISQLLADHNIIDDFDEFNRYLETEGYAPYLQLGEHELSSEMSHFEIAEEIARKR